jgi:hypothetical protein
MRLLRLPADLGLRNRQTSLAPGLLPFQAIVDPIARYVYDLALLGL